MSVQTDDVWIVTARHHNAGLRLSIPDQILDLPIHTGLILQDLTDRSIAGHLVLGTVLEVEVRKCYRLDSVPVITPICCPCVLLG